MDPHTHQLWVLTLVLAAAVVIVVAILLEMIVRTARGIHERVHEIWTGGKRIAGNTVTLAFLHETNDLAGKILGSASEIAKASSRLRRAAGGEEL